MKKVYFVLAVICSLIATLSVVDYFTVTPGNSKPAWEFWVGMCSIVSATIFFMLSRGVSFLPLFLAEDDVYLEAGSKNFEENDYKRRLALRIFMAIPGSEKAKRIREEILHDFSVLTSQEKEDYLTHINLRCQQEIGPNLAA